MSNFLLYIFGYIFFLIGFTPKKSNYIFFVISALSLAWIASTRQFGVRASDDLYTLWESVLSQNQKDKIQLEFLSDLLLKNIAFDERFYLFVIALISYLTLFVALRLIHVKSFNEIKFKNYILFLGASMVFFSIDLHVPLQLFRQTLSISLIIIGLLAFYEAKFLKYLIFFVASSFHAYALALVSPVILSKNKKVILLLISFSIPFYILDFHNYIYYKIYYYFNFYEEVQSKNRFNIDFIIKYAREIITLFVVSFYFYIKRSIPQCRNLFIIILGVFFMGLLSYLFIGSVELTFNRVMLPISFTFSVMVMSFLIALFPRQQSVFLPILVALTCKLVILQSSYLIYPNCKAGLAFGC